jgi:polyisoprenoid-binding protein YceI
MIYLTLIFFLQWIRPDLTAPAIFEIKKGTISFHSNAELELIKASSDQLKGLVDMQKKTFVFKIPMNSFRGFNSPLQQEHFNENYLESNIYPDASFAGKIIEEDDLTKDGTYIIRAKGLLTVHGVQQERIIRCNLFVKQGKIKMNSSFTVLLSDHNIKIPRIVSEKLSSEIKVDILAELEEKK